MMWIDTIAYAGSKFAPPVATDVAGQWNNLYSFLLWASAISCVILLGGMTYFALKYKRKSKNDPTPYISHNSFLEFLWSFIPLVIFLAVFAWGWHIYHQMRTYPDGAKEIQVYASQWLWEFEYKNGLKTTNQMVAPVGVPVKLIMTSKDVLHSFYVPSFRIKQDVVPGRYTALTFKADKLGDFHVFCTEYCGTAHSNMLAKIKVVPLADYEKWLAGEGTGDLAGGGSPGETLYNQKGCVACHSTDGSTKVGPSFKGLFASQRVFDGGLPSMSADENYLRESLLDPKAKTVKGFPAGVMPSFQGQLTEEELTAIIDFIKSKK